MRLQSLLLAAAVFLSAAGPTQATSITGTWFTHKAKAKVRITPCGGGLCGRIVWLRQGLNAVGKPVRDELNRDKRYRGRRVLGLRTFSKFMPTGPGRWSGLMYNPADGRTYRANLTLLDGLSLRVDGCRVGGSACGERNWTRAH